MKLYIGFIVILAFLQSATSLKCFVCNSRFNKNCAQTPPSDEYLTECSPDTAQPIQRNKDTSHLKTLDDNSETRANVTNYTFCRKGVTTIVRQENKKSVREAESVTIRSCGWIGTAENSCKWGSFDGTQVFMCTCIPQGKDLLQGCNSAPGLPIFVSTLLGMLSFSVTLFA